MPLGHRRRRLWRREDFGAVRSYVLSFELWAPAISLALMILQAIVSPIPAFALSIANGLTFWVWWGAVLSLFGRALAATLCFFIARAPDYIWLLLISGAIFAAALAATYLLKRKA